MPKRMIIFSRNWELWDWGLSSERVHWRSKQVCGHPKHPYVSSVFCGSSNCHAIGIMTSVLLVTFFKMSNKGLMAELY